MIKLNLVLLFLVAIGLPQALCGQEALALPVEENSADRELNDESNEISPQ
jgi:hypothetical protein